MLNEIKKKFYSTDEENFNDNSLEEAIESILGDYEVDDIFTIYECVSSKRKITDFINFDNFFDDIICNAYDECGEIVEGYLTDVTESHINELKELINNWADKNNLQPYFYAVEDVEEIKVIKVTENDYRILEK